MIVGSNRYQREGCKSSRNDADFSLSSDEQIQVGWQASKDEDRSDLVLEYLEAEIGFG